jgi:outer membrane lipoprotein-sorting protein
MKSATRLLALALTVFTTTLFAQPTNKEAKQLLTEASEKLKSYKNIFLDFNYTFENKKVQPPVVQKETGSIGIKGNDYRLNFMGIEQIRDGKKLYTILKADEEVQVTDYTEQDDEGMTPSSILSLYKKGYSFKLGKAYKKDGKDVQDVELKPTASEEVEKIIVSIEKLSKKIISLKQWGKNGTTTTFVITGFVPDKNVPNNYFKFNKKDYPGYYIAD